MDKFVEDIKTFFTSAGINIVIGIAIIVVGLIVCKIIKTAIKKIMKRAKRDEAIVSFVVSLTDIILKVIIFISAFATMGINTASIIALLGTCGIAIGLALKDSLGNLASGLMIIYNKPFKKGDYIEVNGVGGVIDAINLFNTTLITYDNKKIVLPNSTAINNPLTNANGCETRRVDIPIYVAKGTDLKEIKKLVGEIVEKDGRVLETTPYTIRMSSQNADCVEMTLKVWTKDTLYWDVLYDLNEEIYEELTTRGIVVPSRQIDVKVENKK